MKKVPFFEMFSMFMLLVLTSFGGLEAKTFGAKLDKSQWYLSASIFECSLVHEIPYYGKGIFYHEAGEELKFITSTIHNPMKPGKAALVIEASSWKPGSVINDLGYVNVIDSTKPIVVSKKKATAMMSGLLAGMAPTFTRKAWFTDDSIRLYINSIHFRSVYDGYLECISGLLPVNFKQVERTRVHFETDKANLTKDDKKSLDKVVLYVSADSSVTAIYVDGHTDNTGRRIHNRRLSKARAEAVRDYLERKGLETEKIRTRYHGERYPTVKNSNKNNKSKNRRTTVRLVQGEMLDPPSDDSPDGKLN
ncbi:MAG: outer membrane protein OmpA-like peptidoglycan-associated protein [Pseudohongiellaceae bacterium]|jgi:outer membrane protein OmpA-like peptidoglycan-associated protein